MQTITRKSEIRTRLQHILALETSDKIDDFVNRLTESILVHKIKFPLLEFVGEELYSAVSKENHLELCDAIFAKETMGGLVVIGKILQLRLSFDSESAIQKAEYYISLADEWFICDIIGERVFGFGMRYHTEVCFNRIKSIFKSNNRWVLRGMGAGSHFAIKRGISEEYAEQLLIELLKYGKSKDKEVRQGIGWACKTTAKFHPNLIQTYSNIIDNESLVDNWLRRKVSIGLDRAKYINHTSNPS